jgi:signal transduction histidine kinase
MEDFDRERIGLAIVASIAEIHGGTATTRPREDGGLFVTVIVPSAGDQPRAGRTAAG